MATVTGSIVSTTRSAMKFFTEHRDAAVAASRCQNTPGAAVMADDPPATSHSPESSDLLEAEGEPSTISASDERRALRRRHRLTWIGAVLVLGISGMIWAGVFSASDRGDLAAPKSPQMKFSELLAQTLRRAEQNTAASEQAFQKALAAAEREGRPPESVVEPTAEPVPLRITDFPADDQMMQQLRGVEGIDTVIVDQGVITDAGVAAIATMPHLTHLRLRLSPITDTGLRHLADCDSLWYLNLPHARCTAEGLESLSVLPALRQLRIGSPQLGDGTGGAIASITSLRGVHLIGVPLSDEGLKRMAELPNLESLYLDGSAVTNAGWQWLFRFHPQLHVHVDQHHHDRDPAAHSHHD